MYKTNDHAFKARQDSALDSQASVVFEQSESMIEMEPDRESDFQILRAEIDMIEESKQENVALS